MREQTIFPLETSLSCIRCTYGHWAVGIGQGLGCRSEKRWSQRKLFYQQKETDVSTLPIEKITANYLRSTGIKFRCTLLISDSCMSDLSIVHSQGPRQCCGMSLTPHYSCLLRENRVYKRTTILFCINGATCVQPTNFANKRRCLLPESHWNKVRSRDKNIHEH